MEIVQISSGPGGKLQLQELSSPFPDSPPVRGAPRTPAESAEFRRFQDGQPITLRSTATHQFGVLLSGRMEINAGTGGPRVLAPGDIVVAENATVLSHTAHARGECRIILVSTPERVIPVGKSPLPATPAIPADQKMKRNLMTRMYTGSDGVTHFEDADAFLLGGKDSHAGPVIPLTSLWFARRTTAGDRATGARNNAPQRQLVIIMSGSVELGGGDGTSKLLTAGDVLLAEDTTGPGHTVIIKPDWRALYLPFAPDAPPSTR